VLYKPGFSNSRLRRHGPKGESMLHRDRMTSLARSTRRRSRIAKPRMTITNSKCPRRQRIV